MIKPITIYGNPVLRKECVSIEKTYPGIREVIETMWQTLRNADGCGLAAPQVNLPIKTIRSEQSGQLCIYVCQRKGMFLCKR